MPGIDAARSYRQLPRQEPLAPKFLYAVDARLARSSPVADIPRLISLVGAAGDAGHGRVPDATHGIFPTGAITLVLILAESHLSIHTWPEEDLIAIDLFSCGAIDGEAVLADLVRSLELANVTVRPGQRGIKAQLRRD